MSAARPPIWVALKAHLLADRRKTGVLALLSLVMMGIYARLVLVHSAPESANAAAITAAATAGGDRQDLSAAPAVPRPPARIKPARPLVHDLARDPFAVHLDQFGPDPEPAVHPLVQPGHPETQPAAPQQQFVLQSTLCGSLPMAWINGRCVQPGESIDGFVLERVEPSRVLLRRGSETRMLNMD